MNELTGAFVRARERGEDSKITRQSLANAGYQIQEIEEAFRESNQITSSIPSENLSIKIPKRRKKALWILMFVLVSLLISMALYFFWDRIINLFGGE